VKILMIYMKNKEINELVLKIKSKKLLLPHIFPA